MAILQMKKLRLAVVRKDKNKLMRELLRLGCIQFTVLDDSIRGTELEGLVEKESTGLSALRSQELQLQHAVSIIGRYVPEKTKLLSSMPEYDVSEILDDTGLNGLVRLAGFVEEKEDRIKRIIAEESRLNSAIESVRPWLPLELPLSFEGTGRTSCLIGTMPARTEMPAAGEAMHSVCDESELFLINSDDKLKYILAICLKEFEPAVLDCLRGFGFAAVANGVTGSARDFLDEAETSLAELENEKQGCIEYIEAEAIRRKEYKLAADKMSARVSIAEAEEKAFGSETFVMMAGWVPAEKERELEEILSEYDCAWETEEPSEEEYPVVPVKLKNNKLTDALNMVTNMYSLPAYGTVDPNPLMAPFFILIYGLMMADIGYGVLMILAALVALKKLKPRDNSLSFCRLLLYCGVSTLLMGVLTGGLFSDAPKQIYDIWCAHKGMEPVWQGLPRLFSPTEDSIMVLIGSLVIGLLHLNAGLAVSFVRKWKAGDRAAAVFEESALWLLLLAGAIFALQKTVVPQIPAVPATVLLIAAVAVLLFGAGRNEKGFGKVTAAFSCIYNTATGWFGDILSYSRIMALMLAGGVVGQVFNTVALMPAKNGGITPVSVAAFVIIFLLGHAMNFGLNLLGCYVHDLRLQCLEFFGKFYTDGGKPFTPLRFSGRYIREKSEA